MSDQTSRDKEISRSEIELNMGDMLVSCDLMPPSWERSEVKPAPADSVLIPREPSAELIKAMTIAITASGTPSEHSEDGYYIAAEAAYAALVKEVTK